MTTSAPDTSEIQEDAFDEMFSRAPRGSGCEGNCDTQSPEMQ
jgi:hypothetical protein